MGLYELGCSTILSKGLFVLKYLFEMYDQIIFTNTKKKKNNK